MSINISNQELPVDNMPHGNSEKQLYADKVFFDKIKDNPKLKNKVLKLEELNERLEKYGKN